MLWVVYMLITVDVDSDDEDGDEDGDGVDWGAITHIKESSQGSPPRLSVCDEALKQYWMHR